jgi:hypothetical protein
MSTAAALSFLHHSFLQPGERAMGLLEEWSSTRRMLQNMQNVAKHFLDTHRRTCLAICNEEAEN